MRKQKNLNSIKIRKKPVFSHDKFFKSFYSEPKLASELLPLIFTKKEMGFFDLTSLNIEKNTLGSNLADLILP